MTTIKTVHGAAMNGAFPAMSTARDCAHCRHSRLAQTTSGWRYLCKLLYDVQNAKTCEDFKDARKPSGLSIREPAP